MFYKILLISIFFITSTQAKDIFSKLPYGMVLGKALPVKVENKLVKTKFQYQVTGKFALKIEEDSRIVHAILFSYDDYDIPSLLPKAWRRAGLKLCYEDSNGTLYEDAKSILKANDAYAFDEDSDQTRIILDFKVPGNINYEFVFYKKVKEHEHGAGLPYITITHEEGVDGYDDDY